MNRNLNSPEQIISLPTGACALQGVGEKFSPDLHTGTGNVTVPITLPPGRRGFHPELSLVYSTGNGNGPFGLGWNLGVPGVSRQTSKGVPQYDDAGDAFVLSGAEDLVPVKDLTEFSFRQQFPDAWYDLHYPEQVEAQNQMVARFETGSEDFPANMTPPTIRHILAYIAPSGGRPFADVLGKLTVNQLKASLYFTPQQDPAQNGSTVQAVGGEASSQDGRFSTLAGNAVSWKDSIATGKITPYGEWKLALPNTDAMKECFEDELIEDILFVITYSGRTPEWPA